MERNAIDLAAIRARLEAGEGKQVWRSLEELADTDEFREFLQKEFPRETDWVRSLSRREFLKLLAAPLALAGLSACQPQPQELLVPYVEAPEQVVPGRPLFFATAMEMDGYGRGLLVENHMGRPIKVEGNPQHPASLGATDVFSQASVLSLYDPERAQVVSSGNQIQTWEAFQAVLARAMEAQRTGQGTGLRLLTGTVTSPTFASQIQALIQQYPQARLHQFDPIGRDNYLEGARAAFGEAVETRYSFQEANVVLSLDSNFVFWEPGSLRYLHEFASRRQVIEAGTAAMNRLYAVESSLSTLGGFADHRLPMQATQIEGFTRALAARLGIQVQGTLELSAELEAWIDALAADLQENEGSSLVLVGDRQPAAVHALGHAINAALGNVGRTVFYTDPVPAFPDLQGQSLRELAQDLEAGRVDLLVVLEGNPVFTAPADLQFAEKFQRAGLSVYLGLYSNETAALADWHIPGAHFLETWSDTRAFDGTATIVQPLIQPLYGGRSAHELVAEMLGEPGLTGYEIVRRYWQERFGQGAGTPAAATPAAGAEVQATGTPGTPTGEETGPEATQAPEQPNSEAPAEAAATEPAATEATGEPDAAGTQEAAAGDQESGDSRFERFWRSALYAGVVPDTSLPQKQVTLQANIDLFNAGSQVQPAGLEIVFEPDPSIWDGRFAHNAWLMELPRPITKLSWDNAALISPQTAQRLGFSNQEVVELHYEGRSITAPIWILPGLPADSITVHLGYGHTAGSQVPRGAGFNAYAIRTSGAPWFGYGLEIRKTGRRYTLVTTQDHNVMEGRDPVRATTIEEFRQNPAIIQEFEHSLAAEDQARPPSLYPEWEYEGNAWGMAVNLSTCIGCNACVIACQAENNVPIVGKEQVENGREMYWLRLDRYYQGDLDNPETLFQPMLCMHCEKAPCEPVCPVEATVHSSEGLNEMIYNRCVGTRYCSNNCPYKVRRFNFFNYVDEDVIPLKMLRNPDVTVRSRGVMEKCTYCVQRINAARVEAKVEGRPIRDGEVVTACQQACPTQAITFGNINDPNAQVTSLKQLPQNYQLLGELGTQPRTTYLAKIRNPNPRLETRG